MLTLQTITNSGFYHAFKALHIIESQLLYFPSINNLKANFKTYKIYNTNFNIICDPQGVYIRKILDKVYKENIRKNLYSLSFKKVEKKKNKVINMLDITELRYNEFILNLIHSAIDDYNKKIDKKILDVHHKLASLPTPNTNMILPLTMKNIEQLPNNMQCNVVLQSILFWDKNTDNIYQITKEQHDVTRLAKYWGLKLENYNDCTEDVEVNIPGGLYKPLCYVRELPMDYGATYYNKEDLYMLCSDPIRVNTLQDDYLQNLLSPIKAVHKQYINLHIEIFFHDYNKNKNRRLLGLISFHNDHLIEKKDSDFYNWRNMLQTEKIIPYC